MDYRDKKDLNFIEVFHKKGILKDAIILFGADIPNASKNTIQDNFYVLENLIRLMDKSNIPKTEQDKYLTLLKDTKNKIELKLKKL